MGILKAGVGELVVVGVVVIVRVVEVGKEDMVIGVMVVEQWRREGEEEGDEKWG